MPEKVSSSKVELADALTTFFLRVNIERVKNGLGQLDITKWAAEIGVSRSGLNLWMTKGNNRKPGGRSAIRIANYLLERFGEEALQIYDLLGWDRPATPKRR